MSSNDLATTGLFNPNLRMSSLEIAELMGKEHFNVLRDIRALVDQGAIGQLKFEESSYLNSQNKEQPMYRLDFESTMLLIGGEFHQNVLGDEHDGLHRHEKGFVHYRRQAKLRQHAFEKNI